jgi:ketosteroid isomerase-like protein
MPTTAEIVRSYLEAMYPGTDRLDAARSLLADDFQLVDPLMTVTSADDLLEQVRAFGTRSDGPRNRIRHIVADGDTAASLSEFPGPDGEPMTYAQWFWVREGKIAKIQVVYDPRPFTPGR